jgi:PAS domain S-box-containing protein
MTIAIEDAGAERGLLVLLRGDTPRIEAEARTGRQAVEVTLRQETVTPAHLPVSLLHTVVRTRQSVILDDASAQNPFSADEYLRRKHARSVLCLPLVKQTELIGVLYLENNLAPHVFTPARIAVLELLSSQAAISLENARLYAELIHENHERRMAEDALRASEERWRNLFESAPVGVALIGPHGRYVATNPAFQQMIGYAEADLRRRSPADITHEDDRATTEAIIRARVAGDPVTHRVEKRYRRSDGGVIWAEVSTFSVPIVGSAPLFAAAVVDITDRKRAEEDLRRSEASLTEAQRISHTGNWRWNVGTGWVTGSVEHFRIFGFDPAATHSSYPAFLDRVHPDDRPSLEQTIDRAVRERSIFDVEYRIVLPDRSVRHLQTMGHPAIADTADLEFVGTVMDITSRKHADEALRNLQAELAHVARLTTMGELAASLAHEISQPLAAIVAHGNAGLHWLSHDKPAIDEVRDSLSRIVQDGVRAADVIRGLRALVMKSEPRLIRLDIDETIREVLALARGELQRHLVVLHTDLSAGDQPIRGDRIQLQQVLLNLIMNAIHAMRGVTDRMRELTVSSALTDPGSVLVAVEDTGTGLDPAIAQRIFEPFFTTKPDGLGMGLSICRSLVEAHGGHLWATPRTPHGTALRFTVPIGKKT